jgi:hypothetical protein
MLVIMIVTSMFAMIVCYTLYKNNIDYQIDSLVTQNYTISTDKVLMLILDFDVFENF